MLMKKKSAAMAQHIRWLTGVTCLLAYLCGSLGALPELCALAASLDRSHTPFFAVRDSGTTLVLSHARIGVSSVANGSHRHGIIARGLCVLANADSSSPDHRLEFVSCGKIEAPKGDVGSSTRTPSSTSVPLPPLPFSSRAVDDSFPPHSITSLAISESLLSTRHTVLLL